MIYLGIFYKKNGKIRVKEFYRLREVKEYIRKYSEEYFTYDIYIANNINNKILTLWEE